MAVRTAARLPQVRPVSAVQQRPWAQMRPTARPQASARREARERLLLRRAWALRQPDALLPSRQVPAFRRPAAPQRLARASRRRALSQPALLRLPALPDARRARAHRALLRQCRRRLDDGDERSLLAPRPAAQGQALLALHLCVDDAVQQPARAAPFRRARAFRAPIEREYERPGRR